MTNPIAVLADEAAERLVLSLELQAERDGIARHRFDVDISDELSVRYDAHATINCHLTYHFYTKGAGSEEITRAAAVRIAATAKYERVTGEPGFQPSGVCDGCLHGVPFDTPCEECGDEPGEGTTW